MAIHNQVILYGLVSELPRVVKQEDGTYLQAIGPLVTISGTRSINPDGKKGKFLKSSLTKIPISTGNPELVKAMDEWKVGDLVLIKGNLITRNFHKTKKCEKCGTLYERNGTLTFVNPIHISIEKTGLSKEAGEMLLREYCEVSNVATIIGTVCSDPAISLQNGRDMIVHFPLAIDRKYFIAEDNPENKTDYPVVQIYGKEKGTDVMTRCHTNTSLFIDGTLRYRKFKPIQYECPNEDCDGLIEWQDWTVDIIPYALEYLSNWETDEMIAKKGLESLGLSLDENE